MKVLLMDEQARATEGAPVGGEDSLPTVRDFLADLLTATVVKREGKQGALPWLKQPTPGRVEYQARIRAAGRGLYVTVGTDQELNTPVVRVQVRVGSRGIDRNRMDKVVDVFDLDVTADTETRETFSILRQAIASQVAANERKRHANARASQTVEMRSGITAEAAEIIQRYFANESEEEGEE